MAEGKIVATLKAGRDFDAPWITLGADSPEELAALVDRAGQAGLGAAVANASRGLQSVYNVAAVVPVTQVGYEQTPNPATVQAAPVAPTAAPPGVAPAAPVAAAPSVPQGDPKFFCIHGARKRYDGTKNNRAYTAYFCGSDLPKGHPDQCAPSWG